MQASNGGRMSFIVTKVDSYRAWSKDGTVVDMLTGEPRRFPTAAVARAFADLSHYGSAKVQELR